MDWSLFEDAVQDHRGLWIWSILDGLSVADNEAIEEELISTFQPADMQYHQDDLVDESRYVSERLRSRSDSKPCRELADGREIHKYSKRAWGWTRPGYSLDRFRMSLHGENELLSASLH